MTDAKPTHAGDENLRARFDGLRAETRTPSFESVLERAAAAAREQPALGVVHGGSDSRRRILRVGVWASGAIAATLAGLLLFDRGAVPGSSDNEQFAELQFTELVAAYSQDMSARTWRSPTSGLLDVPGMELVRGVPSLGLPSVGLDPAGVAPR